MFNTLGIQLRDADRVERVQIKLMSQLSRFKAHYFVLSESLSKPDILRYFRYRFGAAAVPVKMGQTAEIMGLARESLDIMIRNNMVEPV